MCSLRSCSALEAIALCDHSAPHRLGSAITVFSLHVCKECCGDSKLFVSMSMYFYVFLSSRCRDTVLKCRTNVFTGETVPFQWLLVFWSRTRSGFVVSVVSYFLLMFVWKCLKVSCGYNTQWPSRIIKILLKEAVFHKVKATLWNIADYPDANKTKYSE